MVIKINSKIWSAPVVDGNIFTIGCFDKTVYALNAADGTVIWKTKTDALLTPRRLYITTGLHR